MWCVIKTKPGRVLLHIAVTKPWIQLGYMSQLKSWHLLYLWEEYKNEELDILPDIKVFISVAGDR